MRNINFNDMRIIDFCISCISNPLIYMITLSKVTSVNQYKDSGKIINVK